MKVYKIIPDVNMYQSFNFVDPEFFSKDGPIYFDGTPRADSWVPPPVFSLYPKLKAGDFWDYLVGTLCVAPSAYERVWKFFEDAGEILPLPFEGEVYSVLNVTECINVLNADESDWLLTDEGDRVAIERFVFYPHRLTESTIFKIPETCSAHVYALERTGDPEEEFKAFVETECLTGLKFKLLWTQD